MRKRLFLVGLVTVCVVCLSVLAVKKEIVLAEQVHSGSKTAFTATQITRMYDQDGRLRHTLDSTYAVRSDGSWVEVRTSGDGRPLDGRKVVFDLLSQERTVIIPATESKTTYHLDPDDVLRATRSPDSRCSIKGQIGPDVQFQEIGTGKRLNIPVVGYVWTRTQGDLTKKASEEWLAPSLNCFPLEQRVTVIREGAKINPVTSTEVQTVELADPDPSLFSISTDYVEKSPSQTISEEAHLKGRMCSSCEFANGELDKAYYGHQKKH